MVWLSFRAMDDKKMICPTCGRELDNDLGVRIRNLRKTKNMTARKLADLAKVSSAMISEVENGKKSITIATLKRIATALEVTPSALID